MKEGDEVKVNQPLMIVEAMKMETTFVSKVNGKVDKLYVAPGDRVNTEDLLVSFILVKRNNLLNTPKNSPRSGERGEFFLFIFSFPWARNFNIKTSKHDRQIKFLYPGCG